MAESKTVNFWGGLKSRRCSPIHVRIMQATDSPGSGWNDVKITVHRGRAVEFLPRAERRISGFNLSFMRAGAFTSFGAVLRRTEHKKNIVKCLALAQWKQMPLVI